MKLTRYLSLFVSVIVLSAWSFQLNRPSIFRGGTSTNMSEEFAAYGLNDSVMIAVGILKGMLALLLLLGGIKYPQFIKPSAAAMAVFMSGAVYFHIRIGDGIIPTLPAASMLLCCLVLVLNAKIFGDQKS